MALDVLTRPTIGNFIQLLFNSTKITGEHCLIKFNSSLFEKQNFFVPVVGFYHS